MRALIGLLGVLVLGGCTVPRNESPVAISVPDGMVLGRDRLPSEGRKIQRVTYAFQGARHVAVVAYGTGQPSILERPDAEAWVLHHPLDIAPGTQIWVAPGEKLAAGTLLGNLD